MPSAAPSSGPAQSRRRRRRNKGASHQNKDVSATLPIVRTPATSSPACTETTIPTAPDLPSSPTIYTQSHGSTCNSKPSSDEEKKSPDCITLQDTTNRSNAPFSIPDEKECVPLKSAASQRAAASAHFVASVINDYQNDESNLCPFASGESIDLNEFIYIRGGAWRDTILARDINDIDLVIDVTALSQLHYAHLTTYHAKAEQQSLDCPCFMWQRYVNMFASAKKCEDVAAEACLIKKFETNLVRCDFLLNARFVTSLLLSWSRRKPFKLRGQTLRAINTWSYCNWVINVDQSFIYKGIDLKGARLDLGDEISQANGMKTVFSKQIVSGSQQVMAKDTYWLDAFDFLFALSCGDMPMDDNMPMNGDKNNAYCEKKEAVDLSGGKAPLLRALKRNFDIFLLKSVVFVGCDAIHNENGGDAMTIELPLYAYESKFGHQMCDFVLNSARLPLSELVVSGKVSCDDAVEKKGLDLHWSRLLYRWSKGDKGVKNARNDMFREWNVMALTDLHNGLIRQTGLHTLTKPYLYEEYFWRMIKIVCKFECGLRSGQWTLEDETKEVVLKSRELHFQDFDSSKQSEFANRLLKWNVTKQNANDKVSARLRALKMLKIDGAVKGAIMKHSGLRGGLFEALQTFDSETKQTLVRTFRKYGYGCAFVRPGHGGPPGW